MSRRGAHVLVVALSLALTIAACGGKQEASTSSPTAEASHEQQIADDGSQDTEEAAIERGRYLVEGPAHCLHCHSEIDWASPGHPGVAGREGAGTLFPDEAVPGLVYAPNITSDSETGVGGWSDEELARAIREGIGRDGRRFFPAMPYLRYQNLSDKDLAAVIAYIRTLTPVSNQVPPRELPQPVLDGLPPHQPIGEPVPHPDPTNPIEYGTYLATIGNCVECHTPLTEQGVPIFDLAFSGGRALNGPWGKVASRNITTDPSGISHYDESLFISTMRTCRSGARDLNEIMPCRYYNQMTDADLAAIFAFMGTLEPIQHRVSNTDPPTPCKLCGGAHGLGEMN